MLRVEVPIPASASRGGLGSSPAAVLGRLPELAVAGKPPRSRSGPPDSSAISKSQSISVQSQSVPQAIRVACRPTARAFDVITAAAVGHSGRTTFAQILSCCWYRLGPVVAILDLKLQGLRRASPTVN